MKNTQNLLFLILATAFLATACKKDKINPNETGSITLHYDNRAGNENLTLNNVAPYTTAFGQSITISKFDYYISNIQFKNVNGSTYTVPQAESYFLIKESDETTQDVDLDGIPEGDYSSVTFTVGVDSLRSTMDVSQRTGVLDPAAGGAGMYWSWNSGYIFLKLEGISPSAPLDTATNTHPVFVHIGGYGGMTSGTVNNIRTVTLTFPSTVSVRNDATDVPEIHLFVDALKVLNGSTNVDLSQGGIHMPTPQSLTISSNYASMFNIDHIH